MSTEPERREQPPEAPIDFFISRAGADAGWAQWIAWELEAASYTTRVQDWDFRVGSDFVEEMDRATKEADRTILVLSPACLASPYVAAEWRARFKQDPSGEARLLVPIRVEECDVEGLLGTRVYLDLAGLADEVEARHKLVAEIAALGERMKPAMKPAFPGGKADGSKPRPRFPAMFPEHWNISASHARNPNLTGRDNVLTSLKDAFASTAVQTIYGIAGSGKSSVAVEFAYRYRSDYDTVWWVKAGTEETIVANLAALAVDSGWGSKDDPDLSAASQAALDGLRHSGRWLMIYDNAEPQVVKDHLPGGDNGHVLITSRNPAFRAEGETVPLRRLDREQSIAFMLKRTGLTDADAAGRIAEALGDLPLALEQAGAYINEQGTPMSTFADLAEHRLSELVARGTPVGYPDTVATTWDLSFGSVQHVSPAGADLLRLFAFLAPDDIPLDLLNAPESLPESLAQLATDSLALDDALGSLRRYSLIERQEDAVSVHRLVQLVTRDRLDGDSGKSWAGAATRLVNTAFPYDSDDVRTWEDCERLLPHALAAAGHAEALGIAAVESSRLLNQAGLYLQGRARFAEAKASFERAIAIGEAAHGPDHPEVAIYVSNLGSVLLELGDLAGARASFERAVAVDEAAYGPDHPEVATDVSNLGSVLLKLGDLAGARASFERAIAITEAAYGPDHSVVATGVNNLGGVMRALGDLAGARASFERALAIDEAAYGPDHPTVAIRLGNLGGVLQDLGDLAGAKATFERALAISEAAYGPDHPTVAIRVNNLGGVMRALGDLAGAKASFERALAIDEAAYGADHPTVAVRANNLGGVLRALGDLAGAKASFERALAIDEAAYGQDHPQTRAVRGNLERLSP